jgi:hypothetical protein
MNIYFRQASKRRGLGTKTRFLLPIILTSLFAIQLTSTLSWARHHSINMAESNTTSPYEIQYREAVALFDDSKRCIEMAKLKLR